MTQIHLPLTEAAAPAPADPRKTMRCWLCSSMFDAKVGCQECGPSFEAEVLDPPAPRRHRGRRRSYYSR